LTKVISYLILVCKTFNILPNQQDIENFLNDLKAKSKVFGMVIINREKNRNTLAELEIGNSKVFCQSEIDKLTYKDYFNGPVADSEHKGEYWEFGTMIKNNEIYIKVNIGQFNKSCILISFHFSEFKISYPFK